MLNAREVSLFQYTEEDTGAQKVEERGQGHTASKQGLLGFDLRAPTSLHLHCRQLIRSGAAAAAVAAAAAAAKSRQSCPTLCSPIDGSPPGSSIPGILQARTLEWVAISFSNA